MTDSPAAALTTLARAAACAARATQADFACTNDQQEYPMTARPTADDLRNRIRRAICEAEGFAWDPDMLEPDEYGEPADAVLAVLPAPTGQPAEPPVVWTVWVEDESTLGYYSDEVTAKLAVIEYQQDAESPGLDFVYGWNRHGGRLELLANGDDTGIRVSHNKVHGKTEPQPTDRAAVLREADDEAEAENEHCNAVTPCAPCATRTGIALRLRRLADEAQPTTETEAHVCGNCDGVDPDTCFNNPHRPPEQCPAAEFEDYGRQCQKPVGHELHTFEQRPAAEDDDPICGDQYDGEACELDPGHDGAHYAGTLCWDYGRAAATMLHAQLGDALGAPPADRAAVLREADGIGLCGYCGVPRESHHHSYVSTTAALAAAPHHISSEPGSLPDDRAAVDRVRHLVDRYQQWHEGGWAPRDAALVAQEFRDALDGHEPRHTADETQQGDGQ